VPAVQVSWSKFAAKCKARVSSCKVKATLVAQNPGDGPSTLQVNYLLSEDTNLSADDTLVRVVQVPSLAAGATTSLKLKTSLGASYGPKGRYLIAQAISDGGIHTAVYGPIR
jgi:hypothetical protein